MKINITVEVPDISTEVKPVVEVKSLPVKKDYHDLPPYKGVMIVKARRLQDKDKPNARIYTFKYRPEDYPEKNNLSMGVPMVCGFSSVRVNPNKFHPTSKGLLPFRIHEQDSYCGAGGTLYPVAFEVFDFEWEEDNA